MKLDELEKLAKGATAGPWTILAFNSVVSAKSGKMIFNRPPSFQPPAAPRADDLFIAAANPDTVLKLIAVVKAAQSMYMPPKAIREALADLEGEL